MEAVFQVAAELEGEVRAAYLDRTCAGDPELRRRVDLLLAHDGAEEGTAVYDRPGVGRDLLAEAVGQDAESEEVEYALPETIGGYTILETIGSGGMGVVYLAEQEHPRRRVALKVLRPGAVTEELLRRFRFEAELLGRLQHPGIAQIYEAGETQTAVGRQPYFAMEYVDGEDLHRYAERRLPGTAVRLELLARVCDAVHHAHQKGIVHRDLKPGNILVVDEPDRGADARRGEASAAVGQPKILDFGVSRLLQDHADDARLTRTGLVVGTIHYMSPEQATGDPSLDTRSDVYSLGVIGYELISGRLPHDFGDLSPLGALRRIQEQPAPRLDTVDRAYRGDLTIILGKALEIDRERRYSSAAALAEDLRRYLADQPIAARPPTLTYQLGRFVRRNKALVAGAAMALVCLVAGLVLALLSRQEEARQRERADRRAEQARRSAYAAQVQAANVYVSTGDVEAAHRRLEAAPADLRGWEWSYLSAAIEDEPGRMRMDLAGPWPSATPDGRWALLAPDDRTLRLVDLGTRTWRDHPLEFRVTAAHLLPDARTALVGEESGDVHRVDLTGNEPPRKLVSMGGLVYRIDLSPDGTLAAVLFQQPSPPLASTVVVLDLASGTTRASFHDLALVSQAALSPDGTLVATSGRDDSVHILDVRTGATRHTLLGHRNQAFGVAFSPGGRRLASSGGNATIRIWSVETGRQERVLGPTQYPARALAFGRDDDTLVSGHTDGRIRHWDLTTGACTWTTGGREALDLRRDGILVVALSGEEVAGLGREGVFLRSSPTSLPVVLRHEVDLFPYVYDVTFDSTGRYLLSSGWDGVARLWDVATRRPVASLPAPINTFRAIWSPDGGKILTDSQLGYGTHRLVLWDATAWHEERSLDVETVLPCAAFLPDRDAILVGAWGQLRVVDEDTFEIRETRKCSATPAALLVDPGGSRVACGLDDGSCEILDARTLEPLLRLEGHTGTVEAIAFSPDGRRLATGGDDARILEWDLETGRELIEIQAPEGREVFSLRFTRDGRRLLAGSRLPSIRVWDAATGEELLQLPGHASYVHALALSPDGRILASASGDNTVRIWDTRPLEERIAERDRELAAEAAMEALVERLFREKGTREAVLRAIEAAPSLDEQQRHAARNVALRRGGS